MSWTRQCVVSKNPMLRAGSKPESLLLTQCLWLWPTGAIQSRLLCRRSFTLLCLVLTMAAGCVSGIPRHVRSQVTYHGSFSALQADIDRHRGEVVMLGGKVIETQGGQPTSEMTVLQLPVDGRGRPENGDRTEGRFLARSTQFLDPALYEKGTLVTVVGTVTGAESRLIGSFAYDHPVVEIIEITSWRGRQGTSPQFHFGIGVGTSF